VITRLAMRIIGRSLARWRWAARAVCT